MVQPKSFNAGLLQDGIVILYIVQIITIHMYINTEPLKGHGDGEKMRGKVKLYFGAFLFVRKTPDGNNMKWEEKIPIPLISFFFPITMFFNP